jgi:flagellar M-ring protein FliF
MNAIVQQFKGIGPSRLLALGGVLVTVLAFVIFAASQLGGSKMAVLYKDLEPEVSKQLLAELESKNVPTQVQNGGREILVPADQVDRLKVEVSELVAGGGTPGYEIFDTMDTLGATNFLQNVNYRRALEGELARTIRAMDGVRNARVHLVLPKREIFSREAPTPKASVTIKASRGAMPDKQVQAIQYLVANAVPDLTPEHVSIVDSRGVLVSRPQSGELGMMALRQEELRLKEQNRLERKVEELLGRVVGAGRVDATVNVDMDFNKKVVNSETYDPESVIALSTQTVEASASSNEREPTSVSVDQNLPDAGLGGGNSDATTQTQESRTEETVNNIANKVVTNEIRETGIVKRMTASILVDGIYETDANGNQVYQPRTEEDMQRLTALARNALGFNEDRDDAVEVRNMRFAPQEELDDLGDEFVEIFGFEIPKKDLFEILKNLAMAVVALLVILLVVRPLMMKAFEEGPAGDAAGRIDAAPKLTGPNMGAVPPPGSLIEEMEMQEELIDIDKVEGRVKASSLRKIGEIVDKHPEEALSIVRNWLYEE